MHEWACGSCDHKPLTEPPTNPDGKELEYFSRYEPAFKALQKLVMDKQWLKSMKYYVRFRSVGNCSIIVLHTIYWESFAKDENLGAFANIFLYYF